MTSEPESREPGSPEASRVTRRASLARFGGLLAAGLGASAGLGESATAGGPAAVAHGLVSCVLTPELTEGPYYIPREKVRRNITEGKPGAPLELHLGVLEASTCRALAGATVDIWHCDGGGIYSGFVAASTGGPGGGPGGGGGPTDKRTFLRGIQPANAQGIATFLTIYPGWYRGRAVHIHVKVHLGGNVVHTGQLFFSDTLTDAVYKGLPYKARPNRDTRNADDSIYRNGGSKSVLAVAKSGSGYVGKVVMGVHRT